MVDHGEGVVAVLIGVCALWAAILAGFVGRLITDATGPLAGLR